MKRLLLLLCLVLGSCDAAHEEPEICICDKQGGRFVCIEDPSRPCENTITE